MLATASDVYEQSVHQLTHTEKLKLAALILGEISAPNLQVLDISDSWSHEDELDFTAFSLSAAEGHYSEANEVA